MVGIVSYGTYIPKYRLKLADIASAWKKEGLDVVGSLGITEKSVPAGDEDSVTIAMEAALASLEFYHGTPDDIDVLFFGS